MKKYIFIVLFCILLFLILLFFVILPKNREIILKKEIKQEIEKKKISCFFQPEGKLNILPSSFLISFSEVFEGVEGIIIEEESLGKFIDINPPVKAYGKWVSERNFEVYFKEVLLPDKRYEINVKMVPIFADQIPLKKTFSFITPSLYVVNIFQKKFEKNSAIIEVEFNFNLKGISEDFFEIYDSENKKVGIKDIYFPEPNKKYYIYIVANVLKAPEKYRVVIKKNLEGITPGLKETKLKEDYEKIIPIGFIKGPIIYNSYKIEKGDEKDYIKVNFHCPNENYPEIDEKDIEKFVFVQPEVKFNVTASGNDIYIFGDFIPEKKYKIIIKPGLRTKGESNLLEEVKVDVQIPKPEDKLRFLYEGRYFGSYGEWKIPIKVSGIKEFKIDVLYIPPENVLFWHSVSYGSKYDLHCYSENILTNYTVKVENPDMDNIVWFDLKEIKEINKQGLYVINIYSNKSWQLRDDIKIVITDISIVAKWSYKYVYVWTLNSKTLEPVPNVEIDVRTSSNFPVGNGMTDNEGFLKINVLKDGREPYIIFGKKGNEWTYALIPVLKTPVEKFDISGDNPEAKYVCMIYPERNLYRPGEDVNFAVLVRENRTYKGLSLPVTVIITDPKGTKYATLSGETDNFGILNCGFKTSPSSQTGKYNLNLKIGDKDYYTYSIFVETFVPERISLNLELPKELTFPNIPLRIKADYLFGAPAAGEFYNGYYSLKEIPFSCEGDYRFGPIDRFYNNFSFESEIQEKRLDQEGKDIVNIDLPKYLKNVNPLKLSVMISVQEVGSGRSTSKVIEKIYHTKPFYIGLKSTSSRIISGKPVEIKGILMTPDCNIYKKTTKLTYRIYKVYYYYSYYYDEYYDYDYDYDYWNKSINKIPVTREEEINTIDGKFSFKFPPPSGYSDILVEVKDNQTGTLSEILIYGWGWWYEDEEVESPEYLQLRVDKQFYNEGDAVNVEALLPFEGKIMWCVELDSIYIRKIENAQGEIARFSFKAPSNVSNVYVSCLLFRSSENYLVSRAFGIKKIQIRPERIRLPIKIRTKDVVKPGEEVIINVYGKEKFKGTISIVDEGILQITRFKTPDIFEGILRNNRLIMRTAESFGWIIRKYLERTGGGFFMKEEEFPQPRFARIVSHWSGIIESDNNGSIIYKFKVPQYNGRLRIMVEGINETKLGTKDTFVIVKSDIVVQPTIPRFAYTGDLFEIPVNFINTTNVGKDVNFTIDVFNGKVFYGKRNFTLKPNENKTLFFKIKTGEEIGEMKIKINANSDDEEYKDEFLIPVYPNLPYITKANYYTFLPKDLISLNEYFSDFYPRSHYSVITLSTLPGVTRLNRMKYAVHYPYGCIEQTSTSTLLLLRMKPFLNAVTDIDEVRYLDMINRGITRIISMQKISGGFTFWPGCENVEDWASAYATFVLLEAKDAGFPVSITSINAALNYLSTLEDKHAFTYYVLAKGNFLKRDLIDRLISLAKSNKFTTFALLWIAGVMYETGKREYANEFIEEVLKREEDNTRRLDGDFYSPLLSKAIKLYLLQKINPQSSYNEKLVIEIMDELGKRESYYYTTQEIAWSSLALGLYASRIKTDDIKPVLKVDGKTITPVLSKNIYSYKLYNPSKSDVELSISGKDKVFVCIENTGFMKDNKKFISYSHGISITRNIYDYNGNKVNNATLGDILVIEVILNADTYYKNVAVEVSIPAGIEIENPRLKKDILPNWVRTKKIRFFEPDYVDIRDDRIIIFGSTVPDVQYYYFIVRAVTSGEFFLPPARCVVMYDPEKNANTESDSFEIIKK